MSKKGKNKDQKMETQTTNEQEVPASKDSSAKPERITNSSKVREQIVLLKKEGLDYEKGKEKVIAYAIEQLGMKKPLAKRYVKENWDRAK